MALRDRFPESFVSPEPDWLPPIDEIVEDDLVAVARSSLIAAMEAIEPAASVPFGVDIRLVGATTKQGYLPAEAAPIISAVQAEIDAAMPKRKIKFEMAGLAQGSAIIRIRPHFPTVKGSDDELFDVAIASDLEVALQKVMNVHNLLEGKASPEKIKQSGTTSLLGSVKALAEHLIENDLDLNVKAHGSSGKIYSSDFTKARGSRWAEHVHKQIEAPDQPAVYSGGIAAVDVDARVLTIRGGERGGRVEIRDVPLDVLRRLSFDSDVSVEVTELAKVNRLMHRTVTSRKFRRLVPDDEARGES